MSVEAALQSRVKVMVGVWYVIVWVLSTVKRILNVHTYFTWVESTLIDRHGATQSGSNIMEFDLDKPSTLMSFISVLATVQ